MFGLPLRPEVAPTPKALWLYVAKCLTTLTFVFGLMWWLPTADLMWFMISSLLVLSPDNKEAIPLALTRIFANIIASLASLFCLMLGLADPVEVGLAVVLTILLCYVGQVMAGSRSAVAAAVIVTLHVPGTHVWDTALHRALSVVGGCTLGLVVTYIFHLRLRDEKPIDTLTPPTETPKSAD